MRCFERLALMLVLVGAIAQAQPECRGAQSASFAAIDQLFSSHAADKHLPGVVYGVVKNGALIHCGTVGYRDVGAKSPPSLDTAFRIASMTKNITALAVLKLRDEGKLLLDDPVTQYLPELTSANSADARAMRVRELLSHTAGFVTDDPWGDRQLALPDHDFQTMLEAGMPSARAPGVAFEYSNTGYALLGRIVSKVSGMRYQEYVKKELLVPLGMTSTQWEMGAVEAKRRAIGYRYEDARWVEEPILGDGAFASMGGLITTARDYSRYLSFLLSAWQPDAKEGPILAKSSRRELGYGQGFPRLSAPAPGDAASCSSAVVYGFGLNVLSDRRFNYALSHSGGLPGFGSNVFLLPEQGVAVFAFANLTYAPMSQIVKRAASRLHDDGELGTPPIHVSAHLSEVQPKLLAAYNAEKIESLGALLAENVLLDRSAEKRNLTVRALRVTLGACFSERAGRTQRIRADHALSGTFSYPCERGALEAVVVLAPSRQPSAQVLELSARPH